MFFPLEGKYSEIFSLKTKKSTKKKKKRESLEYFCKGVRYEDTTVLMEKTLDC